MPRIVTMPVLAHISDTGIVYTVDNKIIVAISEILLEDLADYARGSIIRGGITDWEAHASEVAGFLLVGDGVDIASQAFDWDDFSAGAGADMVHDHTTDPEGGVLSGAAFPHTLLNAVAHTDTATQAVTQGSIIYGDATPEWNELVHPGAAGYAFTTDATDVMWDQTPTWTGLHTFNAGAHIIDDQTLIFGTGSDGTIEYDEDGMDQIRVAGANWIFEPNLYVQDDVEIGLLAGGRFVFDSTPNPDQIKLTSGDLNLSGNDIFVPDNTASAFVLFDDGGLNYLRIISTDTQPIIRFNDGGTDIDFYVESNTLVDALFIQGSDGQITLGVLGAGFVQSTAGGVLSSTAIVAGDLPAHTHAGAGQGGTIAHAVTTGQTTDDHHAQVHVVNSTGPHAEAGLTIGHVLRVSGAAAFSFAALIAADLPAHGSTHDVGAGDPVTTTSDGAANHSRILASSAAGAITMDDYFTVNGGTFGITGNELLTVNAAGTFGFSGISGVSVENGDWIGAGVGTAWLYDSGNGDITTTAIVGIGFSSPINTLDVLGTIMLANSRTNNANKTALFKSSQYASAAEPEGFILIMGFGSATANNVNLGGGSGGTNAATTVTFYTAANTTTRTGSSRMKIDSNGDVIIGTGVPAGQLHVDQLSNIGNQPVLFLDQGDVSEQCIQFSSDAVDRDIHLWTVNVTGTPSLTWDESADSIIYSVETAATASTIDLLTLRHNTSAGATAADFGAGILTQLEISTGATVSASRIATVWRNAGAVDSAEWQLWLSHNTALYDVGVIVMTDSSVHLGNQRGDGAVDFQCERDAGTQVASGDNATIIGGDKGTASGDWSVVAGGFNCTASGINSFAAGYQASATHTYSFVLSATQLATASWANESFTVRSHGGARFYSAAGVGTGVQLSTGGNAWAAISDRAIKENLQLVGPEILDLVVQLPVYSYNLKTQDESIRHIGPVAQDFNPLFGFMEDELRINMLDISSVSLAAVRELIVENRELRSRIEQLEDQWLH